MRPSAIGQARSDGSGRFQIDAPRTASSRHHQTGAVALAPGYGPAGSSSTPTPTGPTLTSHSDPSRSSRVACST